MNPAVQYWLNTLTAYEDDVKTHIDTDPELALDYARMLCVAADHLRNAVHSTIPKKEV